MKRFLAHIIIEAKTPLKVGGGKNDLFLDAPAQRDFNGLPMILGTSVAGILRRAFEDNTSKDTTNEIFGTKHEGKGRSEKESEDENLNLIGSRLIVSNALLVDENGKVCEQLLSGKSEFLRLFDILPIRDHVAIGANGAAKDAGKFDEEVVFKGTRFKFSLELDGSKEEFEEILNLLCDPTLRLGGGSSKGFGSLGILEIKWGEFELYEYTSSLNDNPHGLSDFDLKGEINEKFIKYELKISPDDFFMFGSGFGDNEADQTPALESVIDYKTGKLSKQKILIPASSVKGALSHRTAFYFNKINKQFSEKAKVGNENQAVREIFGYEKSKTENGAKGKILLSDCFLDYDEVKDTKVFEHVSIDRFTGGAIDAALFQEKAIAQRNNFEIEVEIEPDKTDKKGKKRSGFCVEILVKSNVSKASLDAFEAALNDVIKGHLPLGGATTKGYGFFKGEVVKNGKRLELADEKK
ncbi:CRISPR-associated RAMP protein [Campylobacter rectus RM3267]|uniref:CRISPR/Cas system-associated RAMP protein Csm3, type III (SSO1426 family dual Csm3 domains) n=2 Tax=Campylobacter rectus TaxID=203 RepID=A0A6G5QP54_CAMRE|nr:RAMP superfamily CRISPR-associated protein [Campylobacter rectus]EEF14976.1 CRISPR-associated RAMP protein [Campylobacter rectus RM3267]QCD47508.1 CRISPR/Cas system-associated RAMP protein Csm3, type III (SSO1426 family; dual Csm3 domains) [Campylobacter rectus]UEB48204.1 RAMP superfamily CRISPR-associated protein [Campylobacter rectus]